MCFETFKWKVHMTTVQKCFWSIPFISLHKIVINLLLALFNFQMYTDEFYETLMTIFKEFMLHQGTNISLIYMSYFFFLNFQRCTNELMAHNWQRWKSRFLTCPCYKIYTVEAVGLKRSKYTLKITIFVIRWNLGQFRENLTFCQ